MKEHKLLPKIENDLADILLCEIVISDYLGSTTFDSKPWEKFGKEVADKYRYTVPDTSGMHQVRDENPKSIT